MEYTDAMKTVVSELARIDSTITTLEEQREELVQKLIVMGCTGQTVPSVSGDIAVTLSRGYELKLNDEKANAIIPDTYADLLDRKRESVKLTVSDVRKSKAVSEDVIESISDMVYATVKATVRRI